MPLTELIAVRHGESVGNMARESAHAAQAEVIDIAIRDPDVPLSPLGREQAAAVGRWLGGVPAPAAVWSSPFVRAQETARLALDVAGRTTGVRLDERLRDRELGAFDRLTGRGIARRYPDEAERRRYLGKLYYRPPGGESWADVALRLRSFLADLDRAPLTGSVLLFAHDAVIVLLRYVLEELTEQELRDISAGATIANGSITRFVRGDRWRVTAFNEQHHLYAGGAEPTAHEGHRDVR